MLLPFGGRVGSASRPRFRCEVCCYLKTFVSTPPKGEQRPTGFLSRPVNLSYAAPPLTLVKVDSISPASDGVSPAFAPSAPPALSSRSIIAWSDSERVSLACVINEQANFRDVGYCYVPISLTACIYLRTMPLLIH